MAGGTLILLIIASANVAGVLLTQALDRQREFAMRACLGANRLRLVRLVFIEALILSAPEQYLWIHDRYRGAETEPT